MHSTLGFPAVPKPFEVALPLFVTQPNITDVCLFVIFVFFSLTFYVSPYFLCFFLFSRFSYFLVFFDPF